MNKDQLKAAFAKGARIQAWHLLPGATNSNQGQWDTLTPPEGAEPEFGCAPHLYRVHPEDLIAELGQEVGAVADGAALLVRDVCEMDQADPDAPDTVCIRVSDLTRIAELYTSPAHTSEARDAERYRWLRDSAACSLSISHNDHHNMYMSVADTFDSTDGYYNDIGNDELAKMIETDTIWTLHVYPNTPVGFNVYHGSSLDAVCDAAMRQEGGNG